MNATIVAIAFPGSVPLPKIDDSHYQKASAGPPPKCR